MTVRDWHRRVALSCVCVLLACCNRETHITGPRLAPLLQCSGYGSQSSSAYALPYRIGDEYVVWEGNCSDGPTHFAGELLKYSYDFAMPMGTPVLAIRSGIVSAINDRHPDFNGFPDRGNYVFVTHDDGTIARYWLIAEDGARVSVGQTVVQGDLIALSGASALSPGHTPRLHLDVTPCEFGCLTRPIVFRNTRPHPNGLVQGEAYRAQ